MVHKLEKEYPKFQTEAHEPYPDLNGGQIIRCARGLSVQTITLIILITFVSSSEKHIKNVTQLLKHFTAHLASVLNELLLSRWNKLTLQRLREYSSIKMHI